MSLEQGPNTKPIHDSRVRACNGRPPRADGAFVVYWMTAFRRPSWNYSLDRAVQWARSVNRPLAVVEVLPLAKWSSPRHHQFVLQGMSHQAARFAARRVFYYPFVESRPAETNALLAALAPHAVAIVTDDYPLPPATETLAALARLPVRAEAVDSNGLLPMRLADRPFSTARAFRGFLRRTLPDHLLDSPLADPFRRVNLPGLDRFPQEIRARWPAADLPNQGAEPEWLAGLPLDRTVRPLAASGGQQAARRLLRTFLADKLARYAVDRNQPEADATSGLSPYLHFGQIAAQEIFHTLADAEHWRPERLQAAQDAEGETWWGMSPAAEAFLDQLVTWRELGFNFCWLREDFDQYDSLPEWALRTLHRHSRDPRPYHYTLEQFERAETHDPLWNAAQRQLVVEGRIHNYLRMLWGKKILEWTASPQEALAVMIELNNQYALDGQDPNSYSGILWVLGRYDRPWPQRAVYGTIRSMSSQNTARKVRVRSYLERFSPNCLLRASAANRE